MLKQLVLTGISLTLLSCSSDTEEINELTIQLRDLLKWNLL